MQAHTHTYTHARTRMNIKIILFQTSHTDTCNSVREHTHTHTHSEEVMEAYEYTHTYAHTHTDTHTTSRGIQLHGTSATIWTDTGSTTTTKQLQTVVEEGGMDSLKGPVLFTSHSTSFFSSNNNMCLVPVSELRTKGKKNPTILNCFCFATLLRIQAFVMSRRAQLVLSLSLSLR